MSLFDEEDIIYDDGDVEDDFNVTPSDTDSLKEPKAMSYCLGHDIQERLFIDLYQKKSLPHAMIFSGHEGIGKTTMAFRLARFLLKHGKVDNDQDSLFGDAEISQDITSLDVDAEDPVAARIASGGHADLLHIERTFDAAKGKRDATLKVDALRKIEPFLRKTASEGGWRVVVVEDADTMNRSAQNAILKIVEEPPDNVLIILVAHRPGMLIPTIRSRSRVIDFTSLDKEHMQHLLHAQGHQSLSALDLETLSHLSEGSIGGALRYINDGGLDMLGQIVEEIKTVPQWNWARIHTLANGLSATSQDKEYKLFVELLQWVFRQMARTKAYGQHSLPTAIDMPEVQRFFHETSLERLIEISDGLRDHFDRVEFSNLDRRDAVRGAFLVISE